MAEKEKTGSKAKPAVATPPPVKEEKKEEEVPFGDCLICKAKQGEDHKKTCTLAKADKLPTAVTISWDEIYTALAKKLPEEAIERTKGGQTGKGYDTTGYGYQYVINRFNEVLGLPYWGFTFEVVDRLDGQTAKGRFQTSVTALVTIWVRHPQTGEEAKRSCAGGHNSNNYADALKGAITNGFKKTAGMFGVGKDVYEGTVDDDNVEQEEYAHTGPVVSKPTAPPVLATEKQVNMINVQLSRTGGDRAKILAYYKVADFSRLTSKMASGLIDTLVARPNKVVEAQPAPMEEAIQVDDAPHEEEMSPEDQAAIFGL